LGRSITHHPRRDSNLRPLDVQIEMILHKTDQMLMPCTCFVFYPIDGKKS